MKKIFAMLLALVMMLSLAACGGNSSSDDNVGGSAGVGDNSGDTGNMPESGGPEEGAGEEIPGEEAGGAEGEKAPDAEGTEPDSKPDGEEEEEKKEPALSSADFTLRNNGDSYRITVSDLPSGSRVIWSTSDEKVATVAEDGTVTAVAEGRATITAEIQIKEETVRLSCIVRCRAENAAGDENGAGTENGGAEENSSAVDLQALAGTICSGMNMGDMGADVINSKIVGLSDYTVKQMAGKQGSNIIQPVEVILVECASANDAAAVAALMENYVKETVDAQGWYPPYEMWNHAGVITEGNFVALIVAGDSQSAAESAFRDGVK